MGRKSLRARENIVLKPPSLSVSKNLEHLEEKENGFKNLTNREEKLNFFLRILKIENRKRNENLIFSSEREIIESFLLNIFRDRDSCQ